MIEVLGRGSYGCVTKGKCRTSGRLVALKVMENQTDTEYDTIKLVREIQLMRRLNKICKKLDGGNMFVPELIDVITPEHDLKLTLDTSDGSGLNSGESKGYKDAKLTIEPSSPDVSTLSTICVVMEYMETDLD